MGKEKKIRKRGLRFENLNSRAFWMPAFSHTLKVQGRASGNPCQAPLLPWRKQLKLFEQRAETKASQQAQAVKQQNFRGDVTREVQQWEERMSRRIEAKWPNLGSALSSFRNGRNVETASQLKRQ